MFRWTVVTCIVLRNIGLDRWKKLEKLAVARWKHAWINKSRVERHDVDVKWRIKRADAETAVHTTETLVATDGGTTTLRCRFDSAICAMACLSSARFNPSYDSTRKTINSSGHYETRDWNSSSNSNYRAIGYRARARAHSNRIRSSTCTDRYRISCRETRILFAPLFLHLAFLSNVTAADGLKER